MAEKTRLLIVEDERIVALDLKKRLEMMGFEIVGVVSNGKDAIQICETNRPDLALMDIQIQGEIDGIETSAILRERFNVPHIFLTAYRDEETVNRAKATDPDGYILKPFNDRDISLTIEIALHKGQIRNRLRLSEIKFRSLIQNSGDIIAVIGLDGVIQFASPSVERVLGYKPEEIQGKIVDDFIHENDLPGLLVQFKNLTESSSSLQEDGQKMQFASELRFKHAELGWVYLDAIGTLIQIEGLEEGIVFNARDITERKRIEIELKQAKHKAEEMNRLKTTFLSNISHEIRTPLTGILGFSSILESELEDEEQLAMVEAISKSGQRLLETMEAVIDLALIESNRIKVEPEPIVLSNEIQQAVRMVAALAVEKSLRMKVIAKNEPPEVVTDRRILAQILHNIINNAIKFTDKGSVTITLDQNNEIDPKSNERRHWVTIEIKDTGIGIADDFIPHMFDEFKQESSGNNRKYEGTGIGLSITKRLIGMLKGKIEVSSVVGKGSRFTLYLPL